jgi:hypothetical protein
MDCEIVRVKTMADGSPRFELGAGEDANVFLTPLSQVQASHKMVKVVIYRLDDWKRFEIESSPKIRGGVDGQ